MPIVFSRAFRLFSASREISILLNKNARRILEILERSKTGGGESISSSYQTVNLGVIDQEGLSVSFLVLDESLYIHVEAFGRGVVRALGRLFASFEE